jgi:hypothetical protein
MPDEQGKAPSPARSPGHPLDAVHYREYKLILRPERFATPDAFGEFRKVLRHAAHHVGSSLSDEERADDHHVREVLFYDTARFDLYNHSFILRTRRLFRNGFPQPANELTFKFRHPDLNTAAAVDVTPRIASASEIKFKEELLPLREHAGGIRSLFSHNSVLDSPALTLQALADIAKVFPVLRRLEAPPKTRVDLVNQTAVEEVLAELGQLHFGHGLRAKATLALWRNRATESPLVAEFAFQCKFERYNELHHKAKQRSDDVFIQVQRMAHEWLWLGTTKTAIVYGLGKATPKNRE